MPSKMDFGRFTLVRVRTYIIYIYVFKVFQIRSVRARRVYNIIYSIVYSGGGTETGS